MFNVIRQATKNLLAIKQLPNFIIMLRSIQFFIIYQIRKYKNISDNFIRKIIVNKNSFSRLLALHNQFGNMFTIKKSPHVRIYGVIIWQGVFN